MNPGVTGDDIECVIDLFLVDASPNIEEIGRFSSFQFNFIHRSHCQSGSIYWKLIALGPAYSIPTQTGDISIQRNVIQMEFMGLYFPGILDSFILKGKKKAGFTWSE